MFDLGSSLLPALDRADSALAAQAASTAAPSSPPGAGMARVAERAIFSEALLNAIHARFTELRNAAHG